jgi:hypothetical protein
LACNEGREGIEHSIFLFPGFDVFSSSGNLEVKYLLDTATSIRVFPFHRDKTNKRFQTDLRIILLQYRALRCFSSFLNLPGGRFSDDLPQGPTLRALSDEAAFDLAQCPSVSLSG